MCDLDDVESLIELGFDPLYGNIAVSVWLNEDELLVGFSNGYLLLISAGNATLW
jgi:hypothetical protein